MGDGDGLKCWHSHRKWKQQLARWTRIADLQKCVTKKSLWTKKLFCLCPKIEYFGISVPFCYYSLLGQVIDFPSKVRVVKKIPSTGRVASTRHSLPPTRSYFVKIKHWPPQQLTLKAHYLSQHTWCNQCQFVRVSDGFLLFLTIWLQVKVTIAFTTWPAKCAYYPWPMSSSLTLPP